MKRVIRIGDPTDHGGSVTSASSTTSMFGKAVALVGDSVSCPKQGHVNCVIVEGDPSWTIGGKGVALEGHTVSCGAKLISTMGEVGRDYKSSKAAITLPPMPLFPVPGDTTAKYGRRFVLADSETGQPLANRAYTVTHADGRVENGTTDGDGYTQPIEAEEVGTVSIHAGFMAPATDFDKEHLA
ncbi:PAAR domain-containing protein [Chromobacterium sp. IIBBL 290-4]|uniref:PAAR domain-containing protein n=1 Tax=Chromobacterium sp. IIBBL 290-4 TaxID=2953890 RepID=UPI003531E004